MDRETLLGLWDESWATGIWIAPWSKAVEGLTAAQAAWHPSAGRHSIWQNVNHVVFWRGVTLDMLAGRGRPPEAETARLNFAEPATPTESAWKAARDKLAESHDGLRADLVGASRQWTTLSGQSWFRQPDEKRASGAL